VSVSSNERSVKPMDLRNLNVGQYAKFWLMVLCRWPDIVIQPITIADFSYAIDGNYKILLRFTLVLSTVDLLLT